jgi:thioredoxin 1
MTFITAPISTRDQETTMVDIRKLDQRTFERSILHGVTLLDFDAPWCGPCREQQPVIDALKKNYHGKAAIRKINIDENRDIALNLGIQSIPTIILFKEGREITRFIGLQTSDTLGNALKQLID